MKLFEHPDFEQAATARPNLRRHLAGLSHVLRSTIQRCGQSRQTAPDVGKPEDYPCLIRRIEFYTESPVWASSSLRVFPNAGISSQNELRLIF